MYQEFVSNYNVKIIHTPLPSHHTINQFCPSFNPNFEEKTWVIDRKINFSFFLPPYKNPEVFYMKIKDDDVMMRVLRVMM